jgi:hypothetical protein
MQNNEPISSKACLISNFINQQINSSHPEVNSSKFLWLASPATDHTTLPDHDAGAEKNGFRQLRLVTAACSEEAEVRCQSQQWLRHYSGGQQCAEWRSYSIGMCSFSRSNAASPAEPKHEGRLMDGLLRSCELVGCRLLSWNSQVYWPISWIFCCTDRLAGHSGEVFTTRFDPTGQHIASGSMDRSIRQYTQPEVNWTLIIPSALAHLRTV